MGRTRAAKPSAMLLHVHLGLGPMTPSQTRGKIPGVAISSSGEAVITIGAIPPVDELHVPKGDFV